MRYEIRDRKQRIYKFTGSEQPPKDICTAKLIGTWKARYAHPNDYNRGIVYKV